MNRTSILSLVIVCGSLSALIASTAQSQGGGVKNLVYLQGSTPGISQSGHSNISGTARAGQFVGGGAGLTSVNAAQLGGLAPNQYGVVNNNNTWIGLNSFTSAGNSFTGNGAGLTNVNAAQLGGLPSSAYLQSIPNPLNLNGNVTDDGVIVGANSSSSTFARGVVGSLTSATPGSGSAGVWGLVVGGSGGVGVLGQHNGTGFGVYGVTTNGTAVQGESANGTAIFAGTTTGLGLEISSGARGMEATSPGTVAKFVKTGISADDAVRVESSAAATVGVRSITHGNQSVALYGYANGADGTGVSGVGAQNGSVGVAGQAFTNTGIGVLAENLLGGYAASINGPSKFLDKLILEPGVKMSFGAGTNPQFPIDFQDTLGDKISLWGSNPSTHYGFGIQNSQLQVFTPTQSDVISFGYGSSTNFTERARFTGSSTFAFRPPSAFAASIVSAPYDLVLNKDDDNNSGDEWTRFYTNSSIVEQVRILNDDEAASLFDGAVTANGIDFAEGFKVMDPGIEPGDLVVNSGANWEFVSLSTQPYQSGVIGVVSTRPAFVAGMSFDAEDAIDPDLTRRRDQARRDKNEVLEKQLTRQMRELVLERYRPVAFMGRVPVKVVGPVKAGDKLTASHIAGRAMAMTHSGHSIGIALESSNGAQGTVIAMIQPGSVMLDVPTSLSAALADMKVLSKENIQLKARIERLEQENAELKERLDRIEARLLAR